MTTVVRVTSAGLIQGAKTAALGAAVVVALSSLDSCTSGCGPHQPGAREAAYSAEQLECVRRAATLADSRRCRAEVDARYGLCRSEAGVYPCDSK